VRGRAPRLPWAIALTIVLVLSGCAGVQTGANGDGPQAELRTRSDQSEDQKPKSNGKSTYSAQKKHKDNTKHQTHAHKKKQSKEH